MNIPLPKEPAPEHVLRPDHSNALAIRVDKEENDRRATESVEDEESEDAHNLLFSTRRPKDIGAGFSSALKSVGKGFALGFGSLVALPVAGYQGNGVVGALTGAGAGLLAAVALPVAGAAVGVTQIVRGAVNTPEAIRNAGDETAKWDRKKRIWILNYHFSLNEEWLKVKDLEPPAPIFRNPDGTFTTSKATANTSPTSKNANVRDSRFYDLLDVSCEASPQEITRAYYKQARTCHPDRNKDDPEATKKFQQLSIAYQTLSDAEKRKKYDLHGVSAAEDSANASDVASLLGKINPRVFYDTMFGGVGVEEFVGALYVGSLLEVIGNGRMAVNHLVKKSQESEEKKKEEGAEDKEEEEGEEKKTEGKEGEGEEGEQPAEEQPEEEASSYEMPHNMKTILAFMEKKRIYSLAITMKGWMLDHWVRKQLATGFETNEQLLERRRKWIEGDFSKKVHEIVNKNYGSAWLLHTVGFVYTNYAEQFIGRHKSLMRVGQGTARAMEKVSRGASYVRAGRRGVKLLSLLKKVQEMQGNRETWSEEETKKNEEEIELQGKETMAAIVRVAQSVNEIDVHSIVREAMKKVLKDMDVSLEVRLQYAEAFVAMGGVIQSLASDAAKRFKQSGNDEDSMVSEFQNAAKEMMMEAMGEEEKEKLRMMEEIEKAQTAGREPDFSDVKKYPHYHRHMKEQQKQ